MVNEKERFYEIDLFRFVAALSVVFYHYTFRGFAADNKSMLSYPELAPIFKYGYLGVDLFFMISGFVILLTALNRNFSGFVISRMTRLYPAFWAGVTFTSLLVLIIGGSKDEVSIYQYLANLSMISGYFGVKAIDGVYWTLLVEMKFYFLVGLLILFKQTGRIKYYFIAWLLYTAVYPFLEIPYIDFFLLPDWSFYFIAGAYFYLIRKDGVSLLDLLVIFLAYILSLKHAYVYMAVMEEHYSTEFSELVVSGIITLFYALMFSVSLRRTHLINKKIMLKFGVLTYPLYLIHQNAGYMLFNTFGNENNRYLMLGIVVLLMLLVSYTISRYIENRIGNELKVILLRLFEYINRLKFAYLKLINEFI